MSARRRRRALLAPSALLLAAGVMLPTTSATAAGDDDSFTVAGPRIDLQTARGSAPDLAPGVYHSTVPADQTTRYAKVTRHKGETLTVSVGGVSTAAKNGRMTDEDTLSLELVTPQGDTCDSEDRYRSEGDPVGPLMTDVVLDAGENGRSTYLTDACRKATTLYVTVSRETEADAPPMPVELQVTREPKISGQPPQAEDVTPVTAPSLSTKTTVQGGQGFSGAATVEEGSVRTDLRLGSTVFYRVRVGWSQRLGVSLEVPRNGSSFAPPYDAKVDITLWSPQRLVVGSSYSGDLSDSTMISKGDGSPETIGSYTAAVRYANRTIEDPELGDLDEDSYRAASVAGWYYLEVRTTAYSDDGPTSSDKPLPARLNVKVTGQPAEGPHYVNASGANITAPPPGQLTIGGDQGSSVPWGRIGGGAAAVVLAAIACGWAWRARRTSAAA